MPAWDSRGGGLSDTELSALIVHLRSGAPGGVARTTRAAAPGSASGGNAIHGQRLFTQFCAGCHGVGGSGGIAPNLASLAFQKAVDDAFLRVTISDGRPNTAMPAWQRPGAAGLSGADLDDLISYIHALGGQAPGGPGSRAVPSTAPAAPKPAPGRAP